MDVSSGVRILALEAGMPASSTDLPKSTTADAPMEPKVPVASQDEKPPSTVDVAEAVAWLRAQTLGSRTQLSFQVDEATRRMILSITDAETGQLINEIPTEIALRLVHNLRKGVGALVDQTA